MASTTCPSGPGTLGSSRSSSALVALAMAVSSARKAPKSALLTVDRLQADVLARTGDLLDLGPRFGKLAFAMFAQGRTAFVGLHGIIQLHLAALQIAHDLLQLFHRVFEAERGDIVGGLGHQ